MTTTVYTLDNLAFLELCFRHTTYTIGAKVGVSCLNALEATQILVALFLPFGNQIGIGDFFVNTEIVKFAAYGFALIKQVINIT